MAGGVIRLSPARSKTLVGRILPISPPIADALNATAGTPRPRQPACLPPRRHPRPALAHGVAHRLPGRWGADSLPPRLSAHRRPQPDPRECPRAGRHAPDRAQEPRHLRPLQHYSRAGTARRRGPTRRVSRATGAGGTSPPAAPPGRTPPPRAPHHPSASYDAAPRKGARPLPAPARGRGRQWPDTARLCAAARAQATDTNRPAIVAHVATGRADAAEHEARARRPVIGYAQPGRGDGAVSGKLSSLPASCYACEGGGPSLGCPAVAR